MHALPPKSQKAWASRQEWRKSLDKESYSVEEARKILRRRKEDVYKMIKEGKIQATPLGKEGNLYISKEALVRALVPDPFLDTIHNLASGQSEKE